MVLKLTRLEGSLEEHVARWEREGILTHDQAAAVLASEAVTPAPARRLTLVSEIAIYLGIVLVVASGGVFVNRVWREIGWGGRVGVGLLIAAVGLVGGAVLARIAEPGTTRLSWLLWFCGTAGAGMATAVVADHLDHGDAATTVLVVGAVAAAVSLSLWRNLDRPLQFLSTVAGAVMVAVGGANVVHWHVSALSGSLIAWGASVALALLGLSVLRPGPVAVLLGQLGALMGATAMVSEQHALGLTLGLLSSAAGVVYGVGERDYAVIGVGVVSLFTLVVRLLTLYLRGPVATLVSFLLGAAVVAVALWRVVAGRSRGAGHGPPR